MSTLKSSLSVKITGNYSVAAGLAEKVLPLAKAFSLSLANGTAAQQADLAYHAQRTLAASANEDLDFSGAGNISDPLTGAAAAFAKIRVFAVFAAVGNTNNVVVKRPTTNGVPIFGIADAFVSIPPGGLLVICAPTLPGIPVVAGTGDLVNVANSAGGTPVTYDIVVLGTSA